MAENKLLLGAHLSISGGFEKAIEQGVFLGCSTLQIFTKSNRQWKAKAITAQEATTFKSAVKQSGISPIVAHATYLINIGSPDPDLFTKSVNAVIDELNRCEVLGIPYLVLHPGAHRNTDERECLTRIAHALDIIFQAVPGKTMVLIEIMAGQGSSVCSSFEQIASVISQTKHTSRVGVCFDTAHAFAAGYDFRTPQTYKQMWHHFDQTIGLNKLKVIHVNDSKGDLGSHLDRHEHIGKGKLGLEAFRLLFNDKKLSGVAKILETPKDSLEEDAMNMAVIRGLIE